MKLLNRGEKLSILEKKAEKLSTGAQMYKIKAKAVKQRYN